MPFAATWMGLEVSDRDRQIPDDITHIRNQKSGTNELT